MSDDELPPSKLGTKVYDREVRVFEDVGDEGEVWFGESSVKKMRAWAQRHLPASPAVPLRVLECGSGNGTLLLAFLTSRGTPQPFHLTGIDYAPGAARLAARVEAARRATLADADEAAALFDYDDEVANPVTVEWRVGDLLRDRPSETWDLVLDKGTYDALALSDEPVEEAGRRPPSAVYPEQVARLVSPGGFFLITSCNFTEEEIKRRYSVEGLVRSCGPHVPFTLTGSSSVPHPAFAFGGKAGQTVCTVAFRKTPAA